MLPPPPRDSANQFFTYYSISYDSNRVQTHSLDTACPHALLVSGYTKFCASYSNPPRLGHIFAHLVKVGVIGGDIYTNFCSTEHTYKATF